jgi:hypothetical protein
VDRAAGHQVKLRDCLISMDCRGRAHGVLSEYVKPLHQPPALQPSKGCVLVPKCGNWRHAWHARQAWNWNALGLESRAEHMGT